MSSFWENKRSFTNGDEQFGNEAPIQIGYIIMPPGFGGKEKYESYCRRTGTYSVMLENRTVKNNCAVANSSFNSTDGQGVAFRIPETEGVLGQRVLLFFASNSETPIIGMSLPGGNVNVFPANENANFKVKAGQKAVIGINEDPDNGTLAISISENSKGDEVVLNLTARSSDKKAKIKINVSGDCEIFGQQKIDILTNDEIEVKIRDLMKDKKFHLLNYKFKTGFKWLDKFDNFMTLLKDKFEMIIQKDIFITSKKESIKVKAEKKITIDVKDDSKQILIGNAESMALNESCICQFTGQRHLKPITNKRTKV